MTQSLSLCYLEIPIHCGKGSNLAANTAVGKQQQFFSLLSHMYCKNQTWWIPAVGTFSQIRKHGLVKFIFLSDETNELRTAGVHGV